MSDFINQYTAIASSLIKDNVSKDLKFNPNDLVKIKCKIGDLRFNKIYKIRRVNHYNGRYWLENELFSFAESERELVLKHKYTQK